MEKGGNNGMILKYNLDNNPGGNKE